MASIQIRKETNCLIMDFYVRGQRCREQTALPDTPTNRKKLEKILERVEFEIKTGTFDYAKLFPGSRMVAKLGAAQAPVVEIQAVVTSATHPIPSPIPAVVKVLPTFKEFADIWVLENQVGWRRSHRRTIDNILDAHLIPAFGSRVVDEITKADILTFRSTLYDPHFQTHTSPVPSLFVEYNPAKLKKFAQNRIAITPFLTYNAIGTMVIGGRFRGL